MHHFIVYSAFIAAAKDTDFFFFRFSPVCSFSYESKGAKATHHALNNIFDNQNDGNGIVKQCYTAPCRDRRRAKIRRKWPIFPQLDSFLSRAMMGVAVVFSDYVYNFWHREMIFIEILPPSKIKHSRAQHDCNKIGFTRKNDDNYIRALRELHYE